MKTTDNTTQLEQISAAFNNCCEHRYRLRQQRDVLQTELGNTQFALEEMAAQRDAALAALRYAVNVIYNETAGQPRTHWVQTCLNESEAVIAASQGGAQ